MNTGNLTVSTIDTSPSACVESVDLLFEEEELVRADPYRFERFFRVWITHSKDYTTNLKMVRIVLRPYLTHGGELRMNGLRKFLAYYNDHVERKPCVPHQIYIDSWATKPNTTCVEYTTAAQKVIDRF